MQRYSAELGMYWKSGQQWIITGRKRPVETQSLLIEAFQELHADQKRIDQMKYLVSPAKTYQPLALHKSDC